MTTLTDTQVITASGGLVELGYNQTTTLSQPTSTSFPGTATGVSTTVVCDGSPVLVEFFSSAARPAVGTAGNTLSFNLIQDGSMVLRQWGVMIASGAGDPAKPVHLQYRVTPAAGSHTFSVSATVSTGTGYVGAGDGGAVITQAPMFLRVSKIVQATQWPAVTTGTIICTSSTRPASPFEGQRIYETDTDKEYRWSGSAWVAPNAAYSTPMVKAVRSTTDTGYVPEKAIPWNATDAYDTDSMHDPSSNNTRITFQTPGIYLVTFNWYFDYTGSPSYFDARIKGNGSVVLVEDYRTVTAGSYLGSITAHVDSASYSYVEAFAQINGGTTATFRGDVPNMAYFAAALVGKK